jgi:hypothetical protein
MRRGAARDFAHMSPIGGIANAGVAAGLGHALNNNRVIAEYVGGLDFDLHTTRVVNPYADSIPTIPQAQTSLQRKAKRTHGDVRQAQVLPE